MRVVPTLAGLILPLGLSGCASLDRFNPFGFDDDRAEPGLATASHGQLGAAIAAGRPGEPVLVASLSTDDMAEAELRTALDQGGAGGGSLERISSGGVKVSVPSEVCFPYDSDRLLRGFKPVLNQVAEALQRLPNTRVDVIGYTDAKGGATYNQRLSKRRAQAVADYLIAQGVDRKRIYVDGRGEANPRASNDTEAGRQMNRRVELIVQSTDY